MKNLLRPEEIEAIAWLESSLKYGNSMIIRTHKQTLLALFERRGFMWIPVEDRLPPEGHQVEVLDATFHSNGAATYYATVGWLVNPLDRNCISHWKESDACCGNTDFAQQIRRTAADQNSGEVPDIIEPRSTRVQGLATGTDGHDGVKCAAGLESAAAQPSTPRVAEE